MLRPGRDEFVKATLLVGRSVFLVFERAKADGGGGASEGPRAPLHKSKVSSTPWLSRISGLRDHPRRTRADRQYFFSMMKMMLSVDDPVEESALPPLTGPSSARKLGDPFRQDDEDFPSSSDMRIDTVYIQDAARKVADREKVAACWRQILGWGGKTLLGYHEPPGEAFFGDVRTTLNHAVKGARQLPRD